ncbi:MAG: DUF3857 domain-containing protein [Caulobacterales bacterium]
MLRLVIALATALLASLAAAADQPQYAPPPPWVKPIPIPPAPPKADGTAVQVLLQNNQTFFGPNGDESYTELAYKILTPQALGFVGSFEPSWDPQTQTITFHRFNIIRGDRTIDLLAGGKKVTVLRRETNLEMAMLDGDLTATLQPEGVQVGDIVDLAITTRRLDPVLQGHSEASAALVFPGPVGHVFLRQLWPHSKPIRWRNTDGMPAPVLGRTPDDAELVVDLTDVVAPKPPHDAPLRFQMLGRLELSQFSSWSEVSALMAPLYAKAALLGPNSPLRAEVERIRRQSNDPKARAAAALRLVQDQVRYTFIGMNLGGVVPADAETTWARRFGDCKGKTTLLLALLKELGIDAQPALISTVFGDGLDERLPMLGVFDHVMIRARIDGKVYWLDGTRTGDRDLDDIATPGFHWTLPVAAAGGALERLMPTPLDRPEFDSLLRVDASSGLDSPATAHAEHILRGDDAVARNLALAGVGRAEAERSLREYWRGMLSWVDAKTVDFAFDDAHRVLRLSMDGSAKMNWTRNGGVRDFQIADSNLGFEASFKREPGLHTDAPYAVPFPFYKRWTVVITLPPKGGVFRLLDASDVDLTVAGRHFERRTRIADGVVTMVATERTVAPEFPASVADSASAALRQLSDYDVTVRASGTPESAAEVAQDEAAPTPTDAAGFSFRGAQFLAKRDFDHAIADFDRAVRLDPTVAKYFYNRGVAHFEKHEDALAMADFNQALRLKPDDLVALDGRAELYLLRGEDAKAQKDFDQAVRWAPSDRDVLQRHARAYENAGRYEAAVRVYDQLVAQSPNAGFYNARCWTRAEWGRELDKALADCNAALKLTPDSPAILDSRGLVQLRMGNLDDAISDYDAALRLSPNQGASLYGRGVAKSRKGMKQDGAADIAEARSLYPNIEAEFARYGVTP